MTSFLRFWVYLLCFWPVGLWAVEIVAGPKVEVRGAVVVVSWTTDVPSGAVVRYGAMEDLLNLSEKSGVVTTEHVVYLKGLTAGVDYFYEVGTARRALERGKFTVAADGRAVVVGSVTEPDRRLRSAAVAAAEAPQAPPARETWGAVATLQDHFNRHGRDFGATSPEDYAAQAWRFLQRAKIEGLPVKLDPEGTLRVWDPKTGAFAAYGRNGRTKTYFKPGRRGYFDRQPGRLVRLKPDPTTPSAVK